MDKSYKISIIIPIYNMCGYLAECLESAINQTLEPKEIICIDDGSTDGSTEIVKDYQNRYPYIRLLQQSRHGSGSARNAGIRVASGEYVAFLDSDDMYQSNDVLEYLYCGAKKNEVSVAAGRLIGLKDGNLVRSGWLSIDDTHFKDTQVINYDIYQGVAGYQSFIFAKDMLINNNILFPNYPRFQDPVFLQRALVMAGRLWTSAKEVYVYRRIDKKIDYSGSDVVYGMAAGLYDICSIAHENNHFKCLSNMKKLIDKWKIYFAIHIVNGDESIYEILKSINSFYEDGASTEDSYYLDWTLDEYHKYVDEYQKKYNGLMEEIQQYKRVIIYGAGEEGKTLYDAISAVSGVTILGFAVSVLKSKTTSRGIAVRSIDDYIEDKSDSLVIVATKQQYALEMVNNAKNKGFENIICVKELIVDALHFPITNMRFAVQ